MGTNKNGREKVMELLVETAEARGVALPSENESLFEKGVLDSFGLLEFIGSIEEYLGVNIPDEDLLAANFESIAKIRSYINGRLGQ